MGADTLIRTSLLHWSDFNLMVINYIPQADFFPRSSNSVDIAFITLVLKRELKRMTNNTISNNNGNKRLYC